MTTYWLLGEKKSDKPFAHPDQDTEEASNIVINPSFSFQGPDSPASHSLLTNQSPERKRAKRERCKQRTRELEEQRERIKHDISSCVAKDLINNIDIVVSSFQSKMLKESHSRVNKEAVVDKPLLNGNNKVLITPSYDKELVISKGKVRDVIERFNQCMIGDNCTDVKVKPKAKRNKDCSSTE